VQVVLNYCDLPPSNLFPSFTISLTLLAVMASSFEPQYTIACEEDINSNSFGKHLYKSKRILALCGAGLSAASCIPSHISRLWRIMEESQGSFHLKH